MSWTISRGPVELVDIAHTLVGSESARLPGAVGKNQYVS